MNAFDREPGKVTRAVLEIEDHGILSLNVTIDFGGALQTFGGMALDSYEVARDRRVGTAWGLDFVLAMLRLFGVRRLEEIERRVVYVLREHRHGPIVGLEIPAFEPNGGARFLLSEWRAEWQPGGAS